MTDPPRTGRRRLLASLVALPATMRAGRLLSAPLPVVPGTVAPFPESPRLLVAGPEDGGLNHWADVLQPALEQALPPDTAMRRVESGSADGVTAANQFEARGTPDGMTVLLVPGEAALAWLVGDPRAQFDVGHWVPVMAGTGSGIVVSRPRALASKGAVRIAAATPGSRDLPALLGCSLLGVAIAPVFGLLGPDAVAHAFARREVDAVLLQGDRVAERFAVFAAMGAQAQFTLGVLDEAGQPVRDPLFPAVPHFAEVYTMRSGRKPTGPLYEAWRAAAAAVQLAFGLVLQQLTPAAMVAIWRRAAMDAAAANGVQATGATLGVRPAGGPQATASAAAVAADVAALLELRHWLASRFRWQPS